MQTDACILFDEGAHKSFITETLVCDLHVQRTGTVSLHIAACGEKNDKLRHVDTATISYSCEFEHPVTASEQFDISMLIGADKYCDVIQDKVIRGDRHTAVKSKT